MKNLALITIMFILSACSPKNVQDPLKNELLAYTKKTQIINEKERILVVGSYLNPIYSEFNDDFKEHIILAVYPKSTKINLSSFRLNGEKVALRALKNSDELIKKVAFFVPLAQYFEISALQKETLMLDLSFEIDQVSEVFLSFQKVSKSMYWNPKLLNIQHN